MTERQAIITAPGPAEAIEWRDVVLPAPGPGEVRVRHTAIGINFIDIYHREGRYPLALPSGLGVEAAGVVEALGPGVCELAIGQRVCTFGPVPGAYATARNIAAGQLFKAPPELDDESLAGGFLKACTAEFLVERCARVEPGWPVLVHAAAGGVGQILVQWLKHLGAWVIGTAKGEDKLALVLAAGADAVIDYAVSDVASEVRSLTGGEGVRVTFDGVGRDTWNASLDATGRRGLIVNFGAASGTTGPVDPGILAVKGSLFNTRPTLWDYYRSPQERSAGSERVFALMQNGVIRIGIGQRYALEQVALAHRDLENRKTQGSSILLP